MNAIQHLTYLNQIAPMGAETVWACHSCVFWQYHGDYDAATNRPAVGQCRRRAPLTPAGGRVNPWPKTGAYEQCGEWLGGVQ
jgi:hypothetical protein